MSIEERTSKLVQALMLGYELKCTNGMILKLDEEFNPLIKYSQEEQICYQKALFDIDIKFLSRQAQALSEIEYNNMVNYINSQTRIIL